jgi:hypothetical protein
MESYEVCPWSIIYNFNLFCIHLIHRGYDLSDMEIVNTEIGLQIYVDESIIIRTKYATFIQ